RVWVLAKRQTIHERLMRSLEAALTAADAAGEPEKRIATAIVNLDPTNELACCCLMKAHAVDGDIAGALRISKALWDLLDRDYGMEPSKPTQDLVASVKLGAFERPASDRGEGGQGSVRRIPENAQPVPASGSALPKAAAKPCLVLRPFAMHG